MLAGAAEGAATVAGGASAAYRAGGAAGVAKAAGSAAARSAQTGRRVHESAVQRRRAGGVDVRSRPEPGTQGAATGAPPRWARRMKREQTMHQGASAATHAIGSGSHGGGGASVDLSEGE